MANRPSPLPQAKQVRVLETAYYRLFKSLSGALLDLEPGSYTSAKAAALVQKTKTDIRELNQKAMAWSGAVIPAAYRDSQGIARARLRKIGAKENPRFKQSVHQKAIDKEVDETDDYLIKANLSIQKKILLYVSMTGRLSKRINAAQLQAFNVGGIEDKAAGLLNEAIKAGASRGKLDQILREHFKRALYKREWIKIKCKDGITRNYDLIKYARLVGRTQIREVQSAAVIKSCEEWDNDLVEVSSHGTDCAICLEFEGNVYSLAGKTPGYAILPDSPAYHPNCEHYISPTSLEAITVRERRAA